MKHPTYLQFSLSAKSEKEQCSAVSYLIRQSGRDVHSTMKITNEEKDKVDILFRKLRNTGRQNRTSLWRDINSIMRKHETVKQYITANCCNLGNLEDEMISTSM